jgi:hypothetical protein
MAKNTLISEQQIQEFIQELTDFTTTAENTLKEIEKDLEGNKNLLLIFYERMFAIRGTAQQLELPHVAHIAGLAEEISIKGSKATSRPQVRKCVGALWDALTTIKHLLQHHTEETGEEQTILIRRLEDTLRVLGGARQTVNADEIEKLLKQKSN